jgi:hypothetical protein
MEWEDIFLNKAKAWQLAGLFHIRLILEALIK